MPKGGICKGDVWEFRVKSCLIDVAASVGQVLVQSDVSPVGDMLDDELKRY